ncbi:MAG TPA: metalloprotease PmbA [Gammaproteobacteria bacterium]|nr:metalloprotease PmbA [Gammaproteobacteria bacterium]
MKAIKKLSFDTSRLQYVAQDILNEASRSGADQAEVGIGTHKGFSISARRGDVETVEYHQDKTIEVRVFFGKRTGSASFSDLTSEAIHAAVEAACHIAKFTDEDPAAGLADKNELAFHYPQLDSAYPWIISVEDAIKLACQCEQEALAYDNHIMSTEDVRVNTTEAFGLHANSYGFMGCFPYTRHEISCVLIAKKGDEMQRDYSYTTACDAKQLESVTAIAKQAAEKVIRRLGAKRIPTMKTPVIYIAEEARGLLGHFAAAIQGGSLYRKASFLLDHRDKKIFPDFMHIQEQPHLPRALGSAPFDDDGVATHANIFVENGVLCNYALGVYSARKLAMQTTGNAGGTHNLTIRLGNKNLKTLLKTMDKGLLITEMMGHGVNLLTGDYSRGVAGFWIEHGEIQYPVHEITVAGKLQNMYKQIVEVGNDVDIRGNIRTGSILLEELMVAGE